MKRFSLFFVALVAMIGQAFASGTISLSLQQQFHATTGRMLSGGKLYFYQSGTLNPQNAYQEAGLSTAYPNPITLASDGRVPFLFFADGTIRVRLTDSGGVVQFDSDNVPVIGSGAGGSVDTTDANAIASTGDVKWRMQTAALAGWVRLNGRTVGSSTSGASERANADTEILFTYLWNNFADSICTVSTGRGASAAADFAANKTITVPDMRGRAPFGLDDMGNTVASRITAATYATPTTPGTGGGTERHTLTTAQMPSHNHGGVTGDQSATHNHDGLADPSTGFTASTPGGLNSVWTGAPTTEPTGNASNGHTHTIPLEGGGSAHPTISPGLLGSWYMRL